MTFSQCGNFRCRSDETGHELPRRSKAGAAAIPLITDTKANGLRGRDGQNAEITHRAAAPIGGSNPPHREQSYCSPRKSVASMRPILNEPVTPEIGLKWARQSDNCT